MRKIVHRILTGAPALAAAYGAIWASAYPGRAALLIQRFSTAMSDGNTFLVSLAIVTGYAIVWWLSSIEPKPFMQRLREQGLMPSYTCLEIYIDRLRAASDAAEATQIAEEADKEDDKIAAWIGKHMGPAARTKYLSGQSQGGFYVTNNTPEAALHNAREPAIKGLMLRMQNLDEIMMAERWVSIRPPFWKMNYVQRYE
jgi:hypothetical protein